jgi:hypothetical protein
MFDNRSLANQDQLHVTDGRAWTVRVYAISSVVSCTFKKISQLYVYNIPNMLP